MSIERRLFKRAGAMTALVLLVAPMLAACGDAATPTPPAATATTSEAPPTATTAEAAATATTGTVADTPTTGGSGSGAKLKVGLVTDVGRLNDKSFNQTSWEGVQQAEKDLGVEIKAIETADTKDYDKNIQQFVSEKYDVIVTVGFALGEATTKAAQANPNIKFIGVDQFQAADLPNLAGLVFEEDKAGYLAGVLAASISKTGNIGAVLGTDDVPPVWRYGEGYKAGAKSVNPNVTVQVVYHSDVDITKTFNDPEWGKTTALSMFDKNADVVFGAGGVTGNGAIFAAKDRNLLAIGVDADQYFTIGDEYKGALVSSAMKLLTPGVFNLVKQAQAGTLKGGNNTGEVGLAPYHDQDAAVSADVKAKIESVKADLQSGSVKTCVSPAKGVDAPAGCTGGATTGTTPAAATPSGAKLKVGLVTDVGRLNDKSFNQTSWEGVQQAEKDLGVEIKAIETADTKDYDKNIQQFVSEKYDVIVTVGFALGEATTKAAQANPNIKFIGVDQFQAADLPNLAGLVFEEDKAGYLAGVLAASISKTGNIGAVLGTDDVPPVWRYGEGYKAGAKSVNPNVTVQVVYHSDVDITKTFNDPEWGKTTALSMFDKNADVVFGAGGVTGNGAIFAAKDRNLLAIGVDADQYFTIGDEYKGALVSSAMKLLTPGVFNLVKQAQAGTLKGGNNTGEVGLAPYHDQDAAVSADVKAKIETAKAGLQSGSVKTCVSPAKGTDAPAGCPAP
ncbi:MAG: BMP family ABC transporter substrate-binding protein [Chloroflexota bacterium]